MLDREINRSLSQNIKHFVKQGKIMGSKGQLGLYDPNYERSSCGVGFITRKDSKQTHHLITLGHEALCSVPHRGGMSSEGLVMEQVYLLICLRIFLSQLSVNRSRKAYLVLGISLCPLIDLNIKMHMN